MMKREVSFDVIRILAIFLIIIFHFNAKYKPIPFGGDFGSLGVILFFLLSGFLLRRNYKDNPSLRLYFKKRFLSIFPLLWIVFISFYLINSFELNDFNYGGSPINLIYSFFGFDGYLTVFDIRTYYIVGEWFTGAILILYCLFPLLNQLMEKSAFWGTLILLVPYFISLNYDTTPLNGDGKFFISVFNFWVGMLIEWADSHGYLKKIFILPALILTVIIYSNYTLIWFEPTRLLFCSLIFLIITIALKGVNSDKPISKALAFISDITFSVYLVHHVLIDHAAKLYQDEFTSPVEFTLYFIFVVLIIFFVAAIFYILTERLLEVFTKKKSS